MAKMIKVKGVTNTYSIVKDGRYIGTVDTTGHVMTVDLYGADTEKRFTDFIELKKYVKGL